MGLKQPVSKDLSQAWRYDSLGYTFAFTIILGAGVGYLLDGWLGIRPFLTIAGTLVGAVLAFVWVFTKLSRDEAEWREEHRPGPKEP
jgi:F0F1-type ATP synthase assembly protein I